MTSQAALLGSSVHDAAQRAADLLAVLLPGAGHPHQPGRPAERAALTAVLRAHGEPEPIVISDADLAGLREAALRLREVFAAGDAGTAADLINDLLGAHAHPPRPTFTNGRPQDGDAQNPPGGACRSASSTASARQEEVTNHSAHGASSLPSTCRCQPDVPPCAVSRGG